MTEPSQMSLPTLANDRRTIWPIMAGVMLAMLLASLDQTIVGTAMPRIIGELQGFDRYAWVGTAYMLTSTITVPIYGKLSDIFGRKLIFLIGITIFVAGSALAGISQSMNQLILFRGLQGLGGGALMPIAIAVIGDLFPPKERGKVQGLMGSVWGLAAIIGPSLGGWITDHSNWRWVFYINLPVGVLAFVVLTVLMPPLRNNRQAAIDYVGATLMIGGLVPLLLALSLGGTTYAWGSAQIIGLFAVAVLLLIAFVLYELRQAEPILEPRLFQSSIYAISVIASFLIGAGMFGAITYIPLFVQGVIGTSATASGAVLTPLMLTSIVGSVISGQLMSRWGRYRYIALFGLAIMSGGMWLLTRFTIQTTNSTVVVAMLVLGLGMGFCMALFTIIVQNAFSYQKLGQVTSGLSFFRSIGGTMGMAIMGSIMTNTYQSDLVTTLPTSLKQHLSRSQLAGLANPQALTSPTAHSALVQSFSRFGRQGQVMVAELMHAIEAALTAALHNVFIGGLFMTAIAFVTVLFLREIPLRSTNHTPSVAPSDEITVVVKEPVGALA